MIAIDRGFNENSLGFGKFSKFLQYAETEGVVTVKRTRDGSYRVRLTEAPATATAPTAPPGELDVRALGLPTTAGSIKSYFANRYKGVGIKTAERLVENFGAQVFQVLQREPERVRKVLTRSRADSVLTAWAEDYGRRRRKPPGAVASAPAPSRRKDGGGEGGGDAIEGSDEGAANGPVPGARRHRGDDRARRGDPVRGERRRRARPHHHQAGRIRTFRFSQAGSSFPVACRPPGGSRSCAPRGPPGLPAASWALFSYRPLTVPRRAGSSWRRRRTSDGTTPRRTPSAGGPRATMRCSGHP